METEFKEIEECDLLITGGIGDLTGLLVEGVGYVVGAFVKIHMSDTTNGQWLS